MEPSPTMETGVSDGFDDLDMRSCGAPPPFA
jgi:hypothetical protein